MGLLFPLELLARAPPRALLADLLGLEHETLRLDDVEEEFAHKIGRRRVGLLQARPESERKKPFVKSLAVASVSSINVDTSAERPSGSKWRVRPKFSVYLIWVYVPL